MIGKTIAHYQVTAKLGAGGMGEVYRAQDTQLGRQVAIKIVKVDRWEDVSARERLLREARAAAALNHPNICTVHEVGEAQGQAYIVMELIEGRPLSELIPDHGLPLHTLLRYARQIAAALAHAHERGLVHRDLKPSNIVVTGEGNAKVLDFGLARRLPDAEQNAPTESLASLTVPGTIVGTLAYMPPEQLRGEPADARSDVWALGVVLYQMATGSRPFCGRTSFELSAAILSQPVRDLPARTPAELRAVIDRCLAREPGRRYARGGEVRAALETITADTATRVVAEPRQERRLWLLSVAVAVLLALLAGALNFSSLRERLFPRAAELRMESLAVLPLENLSGDPAQDYLASGIHEALITDLAKLSGFRRVIARSSVKRYEKTSLSPQQIAGELHVDALLTGSVVRAGNRVQITASLISASETPIWSERYDREFRDVLSLQNEIVTAVTQQIRLKLTPLEQARLQAQRPVSPEAFEAYLQGRFHRLKQTREDFDLAERYFQFALAKDPNYALAYAGLGTVWLGRGDSGFLPPRESFSKGAAFLARAVEMDDSSAELHVSLANQINSVRWDWPEAEKEFHRALAINPNLADAHFFYADMLIVMKRPQEWEREIKRARELDPLNDFNESFYGWHLNYLHRYDEAIPIFQKLLLTGPNKGSNYLGLWGAYYKKGMYDQALAAARNYFSSIREQDFAAALGPVRGEAAYRTAMHRVAQLMAAQSKRRHIPAVRIARMYAHAGDKDTAMQWLEKAYQNRESPLIRLAVFWDWDTLRSDPRFLDLLRRMNLPQ